MGPAFRRGSMVVGWLATGSQSPAFLMLAALNVVVLFLFLSRPTLYTLSEQHATHSVSRLEPFVAAPSESPDLSDPALRPPSCELCLLDPTHPLCRPYGYDNVRLSRAFEGSGFRVQRFLRRALAGEPVRIGILGASVSQGHGVKHKGLPTWQEVFFKDFQSMFPNAIMYEGLAGGVDSEFFSFCYHTLIPSDMDIYLLELDINNNFDDKTFIHDDRLFRNLLGLPQEPAVMRATAIALLFGEMIRGAASSMVTASYFDIPVIGLRNSHLPHLLLHPEERVPFFSIIGEGEPHESPDLRHMSGIGHQTLGDMVSIYMRDQLCEMQRRLDFPPHRVDAVQPNGDWQGIIPRLPVYKKFSINETVLNHQPTCAWAGSKTHVLEPARIQGKWHLEEWNGKFAWASHSPGSKITFNFTGTEVGAFIWETMGLETDKVQPGRAIAVVDHDGRYQYALNAYQPWRTFACSNWRPLHKGLKPGAHTITFVVLPESNTTGHEFRVLGVAAF